MAFADLCGELVGLLPGLSPFLAAKFINDAWRMVRDHRRWSSFIADAVVNCPAQIATGTVNITQFGTTAVCSAAARTALLAVYDLTAITTKVLALTSVQIRFMGTGQTSEIYNITNAVDNVGVLTLTLDRKIQESTNTASEYLVYRVYIAPPVSNFLQWVSLSDMINGIQIGGDRLTYTSSYFDARDPQRQSLGQAFYCGYYKASAVAADNLGPVYELWPGCTQGQTWYCRYRVKGADFALPGDVQPAIFPDQLIIQTALLEFAYPYCQANIGHFPAMKGVNWPTLILHARETVHGNAELGKKGLLRAAALADDDMAMQSVWNRGHGLKPERPRGFYGPVDSNWIQQHAVSW